MGSTLPDELSASVDHVVPILQARGRFRTGYAGETLRGHLGLERPAPHRATDRPATVTTPAHASTLGADGRRGSGRFGPTCGW